MSLLPPRTEWRRLYRYWVRDSVAGARLLAVHEGMRLLPTDTVSAIGSRLGRFAGPRAYPRMDRQARLNLQALRPDLVASPEALEAAMVRVWDAQGRVTVEGQQNLTDATAAGRPLIVAGLHLGNWEVLPITFGFLGHRFVQVYQPQRNRFVDRIAKAARLRINRKVDAASPGAGCTLLPPSPGAGSALVHALRAGDAVLMFVDEYVGGRVHAPSFGRMPGRTGNITRVVRLARLAGAAVVPAYTLRTGGARFVVRFLPPIPLQATAAREADIEANQAALDAAVSGAVLDHLEQWFMVGDFRMDR